MKNLVVLLALTLSAAAQSPSPPGRIVTTTRLVGVFSGLESDLENAIQRKDANAVNHLMSEDFQVWTPAPPGHPIPREDWWNQVSSEKLESFHIRQMAVRAIAEDTSIASFVLSETFNQGTAKTRNTFVVDVWKQSADKWQLTDRYAASVAPQKASAPTGDKRPTGRQ
jgi:hypothetical protein